MVLYPSAGILKYTVAISAGSGILQSMIQKIETTDRKVQAQYLLDGVLVTICKPAKPRKSERTWRATKGSIAQLGAKGATLRNAGLAHAKG